MPEPNHLEFQRAKNRGVLCIEKRYLQRYLDKFDFRFKRRKTKVVGKRFFRLAQQVAASMQLVNTSLAPVIQRLAN